MVLTFGLFICKWLLDISPIVGERSMLHVLPSFLQLLNGLLENLVRVTGVVLIVMRASANDCDIPVAQCSHHLPLLCII